jgi:predicted glycoside hydrolase/deacetylase ChbG (UPF0249 family)
MLRRRELIINADDFGFSNERDRGIIDSFVDGVLTSATLLVNGSTARSAVALAKTHGLPLGLHLNLTEGFPISSVDEVSSLLGADSQCNERPRFLGKFGASNAPSILFVVY